MIISKQWLIALMFVGLIMSRMSQAPQASVDLPKYENQNPFIEAPSTVFTPETSIPPEVKSVLSMADEAVVPFGERQDIIDYICSKDWDCQKMVNIFTCESGLRPDAHNYNPATADDSWGIGQINLYGNLAKNRPSPEQLLDWKFNIDYAFSMWQAQGVNPWSCSRREIIL